MDPMNIIFLVCLISSSAVEGLRLSYKYQERCAGDQFNIECRAPPTLNKTVAMKVRSVTVTLTSNFKMVPQCTDGQCSRSTVHCNNTCSRVVRSQVDVGIEGSLKYLYNEVLFQCEGKSMCTVNLPKVTQIVTNSKFEAERDDCLEGQLKYFLSARIHVDCVVGQEFQKYTGPPPTLPPTIATTPSTTTPYGVIVYFLQPSLSTREKIILGSCIGAAIILIILTLALCYSWERNRERNKQKRHLKELGKPQFKADSGFGDDYENYGKSEAWQGESGFVHELTGVRPLEFLDVLTLKKDQDCASLDYFHSSTLSDHRELVDRSNRTATLGSKEHRHDPCGSPQESNNNAYIPSPDPEFPAPPPPEADDILRGSSTPHRPFSYGQFDPSMEMRRTNSRNDDLQYDKTVVVPVVIEGTKTRF